MSPFSVLLLSLSMSADAFAASIARGCATRPSFAHAIRGGLVFGMVEAITPLIGWTVGLATSSFVGAVDHWIAFVLLAVVGGKMILEAVRRDGSVASPAPTGRWTLIVTAVGTSIDAAAVGVSLALVGVNILLIALSIGLATFVMTTIGLTIGRAAGAHLGSTVEVLGGIVLIGIGTMILSEHLGLLPSILG